MKSLASLAALIALAAPAVAQEPPPGDGPRGSSEPAAGERRFDEVGLATVSGAAGHSVATAGLADGYAEVTALDSGRTALALVVANAGARFAVSPALAAALGIGEGAPVRIRRTVATPQDVVLLRSGQAASSRIDSPPALLVALRKKLPVAVAAKPIAPDRKPTKPAPKPAPVKTAIATKPAGSFAVQVATLSSAERARALAGQVGGTVIATGTLHRVRIGPLPDRAAAERARTRAAGLGYRDAAIIRAD